MSNELLKVLDEYNRLGIQQQLDYDKFYLYSIITHSTAIEGSTITEVENQLLFDEGLSANKPMPEQKEIIEYKDSMKVDLLEGGQKLKGGQKEWSETTQKVFDIIKSNPLVTRQQLCDELKINPSAIQKHIEKLKAQNVIKRQGGAKGGHWEILK